MPCEVYTGDAYLEQMFPGAAANVGRNAGILAGYVVASWGLVYLVFRARGVRHLH